MRRGYLDSKARELGCNKIALGDVYKRQRLNAPATATPAPTLPLTSRMTVCTIAGSTATVTAKP